MNQPHSPMTHLCPVCNAPTGPLPPGVTGNPQVYHWQCAYDSLATTREQLATFRQELSDRQAPATLGQPTPATPEQGATQWTSSTSKPNAKDEPPPATPTTAQATPNANKPAAPAAKA